MKSNKFICAAAVAIAGLSSVGAFAQNAQYGEAAQVVAPVAFISNATRAQVESAYIQARQNGTLAVSQEGAFSRPAAFVSTLSRDEVQTEATHYVIMDGSNRKIYR